MYGIRRTLLRWRSFEKKVRSATYFVRFPFLSSVELGSKSSLSRTRLQGMFLSPISLSDLYLPAPLRRRCRKFQAKNRTFQVRLFRLAPFLCLGISFR